MDQWTLVTYLFVVNVFQTAFVDGDKIKDMCLEKVGLTPEELRARHRTEIPNPNVKCFLKCFLENIGVIAGNAIIPGGFAKVLGPLVTDEAVERMETECHVVEADPNEEDPCEFAWLMSSCYERLTLSDLRQKL
ncbi:general odorant-binding protein 56d [Drosophila elegans]|uniref:general odorant-binding protein 56d n=1 Tax=Drosophila elegans TaxID=30023 RepID=UPI0007E7644A|nr:general odorant-binding protein 56d [Drosophila elegans]